MLKEFEPRVQQFLRTGAPSAGFQSLLNLLNGKYLAVPKPLELDMAAYPLRFEGGRFRLYENPQVLPWFYLVPRSRGVGEWGGGVEAAVEWAGGPAGGGVAGEGAGGAARWGGGPGGGPGGAAGV